MDTIDVGSRNAYPAGVLSNFAAHPFVIDDVKCASMEGFLQSLKFPDQTLQLEVCQLVGFAAKNRGKDQNWQTEQYLHWKGFPMQRMSPFFRSLIEHAYDALLAQNPLYGAALIATGNSELTHSVGRSDPKETVLTEQEFCDQLRRLRSGIQALGTLHYYHKSLKTRRAQFFASSGLTGGPYFFPVLHLPANEMLNRAKNQLAIAADALADGVLLICHEPHEPYLLTSVAKQLQVLVPEMIIGINYLGLDADEAIREVSSLAPNIKLLWSDSAGTPDEVIRTKHEVNWDGLFCGGVAFKTQASVSDENLPRVVHNAASFMDVMVTSGPGTGRAASADRVRTIHELAPDVPLALASGVTAANAATFTPHAQLFFVGTSIEKQHGHLDPVKTAELAYTLRTAQKHS